MTIMMTHDPTTNLAAIDRINEMASGKKPERQAWLQEILERTGPQTLDALGASIPSASWAQLFLAVDGLSRSGAITLRSIGRGTYLVSLARQRK
jgi:hypothetical protein